MSPPSLALLGNPQGDRFRLGSHAISVTIGRTVKV